MLDVILMSIRPKWVAKILIGIKTKEIRKLFPKNFRGWIYIYCTKEKTTRKEDKFTRGCNIWFNKGYAMNRQYLMNGKVVARFWCDNVTEYINGGQWHDNDTFGSYDDYIKDNILKQSCLTEKELFAYCEDLAFSAINISRLEVFDKPLDIDCFIRKDKGGFAHTIKRPPQSWCYIHGQVIGGNPL